MRRGQWVTTVGVAHSLLPPPQVLEVVEDLSDAILNSPHLDLELGQVLLASQLR
jgi:hypothetical protein